ncbi:PREDICTED: ER membrane protein complex subunit 10-like [Tarenaya hassleriana]|uniref:ER membrane protein complex subunit 10-like n=1 Tax=Tarenaya hassleriana TaxID=28532 RepID=UPI00053C804B|nr:PREDICTED: ER membrane protein complex subunit 10-like [Tarenaya hassleriana]
MATMAKPTILFFFGCFLFSTSIAFQSDELLLDDDEFGLEGAKPRSAEPLHTTSPTPPPTQAPTIRRRFSDSDSDSKIQFTLEHAFGDSDFSPAGTFSARLKTWSHGGQTLTKLRFSRNGLSDEDKDKFNNLLKGDDFYRIRLPSNVLSAPGREYVIASVKARCLARDGLDEHIVIHMDGVNILAVNYGSPGACPYPRQLKFPSKWSFNSHTILKSSEQAPRTPIFTEEILGGEKVEGEAELPPERSFWAKYWMYVIPLGLIVMNAVTQAMNMAEEPAGGQAGGGPQGQQSAAAIQRGSSSSAVRRR